MLLSVRAVASYELTAETFLCLMVEPPLQGPAHRVEHECLLTSPTTSCNLRRDLYGNPQRHLVAPKGRFSYEFRATVEVVSNPPLPLDAVAHLPQELPAEAMIYTLPSRFCESDLLTRMANDEFRNVEPGGGECWPSPIGCGGTSSIAMGQLIP